MEEVLLKEGKLLNENGELNEAGYAFNLVKEFNKDVIKKQKRIKLKEWNYYAFLNDENGVLITISNLTYSALLSVTYVDFKVNKYITKTFTKLFPKHRDFRLPRHDDKKIYIKDKKYIFSINPTGEQATFYVNIQNFIEGHRLLINLEVSKTTDKSIVTAIPFKKNGDFYYNEKSNLLHAEGNIQFGKKTMNFKSSYGVLDWGRGVWPYRSTWYWSNLNIKTPEGDLLGFNLGYGLGDNSKGTENVLFFNKEIYKLNDVEFIFEQTKNKIDYSKEIKLKSKSGDIDLTFTPLFNRHDFINLLIIASNQNQVFGKFNGTIKVKDKTFEFNNYIGFLEKVINRY